MQKILITGGAGFTGINFARHYLDRGDEVVIFDNLSRAGCLPNLSWLEEAVRTEHLEVIVGDVRIPPDSLQAQVEECDALHGGSSARWFL